MNYLKIKNIKNRFWVKTFEKKKLVYKIVKFSKIVNIEIKKNSEYEHLYLSKKTSSVRLTKRCILTNKKSIFNKNIRISRFMFLKYARLNLIYGIKKNFW